MLAPLMASQANCADKKQELIPRDPFENGDCSFCDVKPELLKRNGYTAAIWPRRKCTPKDIQGNLKNLFDIPFMPRAAANGQRRECTLFDDNPKILKSYNPKILLAAANRPRRESLTITHY